MDFSELTANPIDITAVSRRLVSPECGATVTLDGYVRKFTKGRETLHLVYEAYEPMALKEMQKLIEKSKSDFGISHVGIVHRLGKLEIGETSVVISVAGDVFGEYDPVLAPQETWQTMVQFPAAVRAQPIVARLYEPGSETESRFVVLQPVTGGV